MRPDQRRRCVAATSAQSRMNEADLPTDAASAAIYLIVATWWNALYIRYAVRAKPGAPVSAPCTWEEVESGAVSPRTFTVRNMAERLERVNDLWAGLAHAATPLASALARIEARLTAQDWAEAGAATTRRPKPRKRPAKG